MRQSGTTLAMQFRSGMLIYRIRHFTRILKPV